MSEPNNKDEVKNTTKRLDYKDVDKKADTFRLPVFMLMFIKARADRLGVSKNLLLADIIGEYMKRHEEGDR